MISTTIISSGSQLADETNQILVSVAKTEGQWRASQEKPSFLPRIFGHWYIVPRRISPPLEITAFPVRLPDPSGGGEINIAPLVTVLGIAAGKHLLAAEALHPHAAAQIPWLQQRVADIVQDFVSRDSCPLDGLLNPGVEGSWDQKVERILRDEAGLDTQVRLLNDQEVLGWIGKLRGQGPFSIVHEFRPLASPRAFPLAFTFRITGISGQFWAALRLRARAGISPAEEMRRLASRIVNIMEPIVSGFPAPVLACAWEPFWNRLGQAFSAGIGHRIAEESGCCIEITDVLRAKNTLEQELDTHEDPVALGQLGSLASVLGKAQTHFNETLEAFQFDLAHPDVKAARTNLDNLEKLFEERKHKTVTTKLLMDPRHLPGAEIMDRIRDTFDQITHLLKLPPEYASLAALPSSSQDHAPSGNTHTGSPQP